MSLGYIDKAIICFFVKLFQHLNIPTEVIIKCMKYGVKDYDNIQEEYIVNLVNNIMNI